MTMHTMYLKEHQGVVQNHGGGGQMASSAAAVPWWTGLGSQSVTAESFAQFRSPSMENPNHGDQIASAKQLDRGMEEGMEKGNASQFSIFPGDRKTSANMPTQSANPEYHGRFELGFGQPLVCAKYPYGDQYFGLLTTCGGPQITGRIMLPLNLATDYGPIYVNAKQYHGIIRRRLSRAKAESVNKALKARKPYLHLSRHLHAMRRPRGCGGRFLNTKVASNGTQKGGNEAEKFRHVPFSNSAESQNSEVLESDSGNPNSSNEENGNYRSNALGSEVTSMFSRRNLDPFSFHHLQPPVHSFSGMMSTGHVMPGQWVAAAANSCCNLKV